ncbi:MAG: Imm5 family immunity protein [Myxococcota bacterium]
MDLELQQALARAEASLDAEPRGHLTRPERRSVSAALATHQERARLALRAAQHVLPVWQARWPTDGLPAGLLQHAFALLHGDGDAAHARAALDEALTHLDDVSYQSTDKMSVAAGYAALRALTDALTGGAPDEAAAAALDEDVSPEAHDAAYLASVAWAGGPPWHPGASAERRRAFWRWWLSEAAAVGAGRQP